jgi:hypothetical protein
MTSQNAAVSGKPVDIGFPNRNRGRLRLNRARFPFVLCGLIVHLVAQTASAGWTEVPQSLRASNCCCTEVEPLVMEAWGYTLVVCDGFSY